MFDHFFNFMYEVNILRIKDHTRSNDSYRMLKKALLKNSGLFFIQIKKDNKTVKVLVKVIQRI